MEGAEINDIEGKYLLLECLVMVETADGLVLIGRKCGLYCCSSVLLISSRTWPDHDDSS